MKKAGMKKSKCITTWFTLTKSKSNFLVNTYKTTNGERITQSQIDLRIRKAKEQKLESMNDQFGYVFCEQCGRNGSGTRLDCSHDISVKKAKEEGKSELCWDVQNITILCRKCHQVKDKLNVQF